MNNAKAKSPMVQYVNRKYMDLNLLSVLQIPLDNG